MALLGAQLVISLIMVSVIQKLGNHSFARWLLCSQGLYRYLYPTNSELKSLAGVPKDKPKGKKNSKIESNGKAETFHVPRSLEIQLETAPVTHLDVVHLRFYTEYLWIVDFSLYTAIVYILSEIYTAYFPLKDEFNLSMVWCLLVVLFSFKILLSLTKQYFTSDESMGERSTCIVAFCLFLLIAMMVMIVDEKNLEVGVDPAYDSFYENASKFLENQGLTSVMTSQAFDTLRVALVVGTIALRLALMPQQLQAYLDMAQRRLDLQKKEAGRITNIDLQKKVASVFYYLCVVALQYVCPIIMCLYLALMYKTLGGYSWASLFAQGVEPAGEHEKPTVTMEDMEQFQMAWENLKMVFTEDVHRGVFGFATWWCCFSWFLTTALGTTYQTYFRMS
ncbi:jg26139 [Pararge aegeria aegeria]|uniref:Jg26139 protein n=1 Tax=Pararge aegeria aegeria TaxID=348720 RepID=A0A8S4S1B9_9NEOP|nr:jg26139 [Pararge aegeria aegeria]